eukprot:NODE_12022_length_1250_cov_9.521817.p1 GENE.NODE_12022_length_1250_cov_9.521817~~NODE_12022_length_1250_cov_9.521817.p1  ORF type:complete len:406 (+),score=93.64 NODE_12022_length_1250_cov_9.521817:67-1218(+)
MPISAADASATPVWPTRVNGLVFDKFLGNGSIAEVWMCRLSETPGGSGVGKPHAVKKIPLVEIDEHRLTRVEREMTILRTIRHPHIVAMQFDFHDTSHMYMGFEFAEHGSMFDALSQCERFDPARCALYMYQICDALEYLHGLPNKVIHRNLKAENVLLHTPEWTKLADFLPKEFQQMGSFGCTPDFFAPEMILGGPDTESLDMWQMGAIFFEMLIGCSAFDAGTSEGTTKRILAVDIRYPPGVDPEAMSLVEKLCRLEPQERLTAAEAKNQPFIAHNYKSSVKAIGDADVPRLTVEARGLRHEKELLEAEMMRTLQAKSTIEQDLMSVDVELTNVQKQLKQETRLRERLELQAETLREQVEPRERDIAELQKALGLSAPEAH